MEMQPEDRIKYLESQTSALESQLANRSETTANALAEAESLRLQLVDTKENNTEEKETNMDVMKSMTRKVQRCAICYFICSFACHCKPD